MKKICELFADQAHASHNIVLEDREIQSWERPSVVYVRAIHGKKLVFEPWKNFQGQTGRKHPIPPVNIRKNVFRQAHCL